MIEQKNPLVLAFVGDAVMTLHVRERLSKRDGKIGDLHFAASALVCAAEQSRVYDAVCSSFTQIEAEIANRARNVKHKTLPKNQSLSDYIKATALEAVIGYNYLTQNHKRVEELINNVN